MHGVLHLLLFRLRMIIIYLRTNNEQNIMNTRHIRLHISPMTGIMTCYDKISIEINGNLISSKNFPTSTNTLPRNSFHLRVEGDAWWCLGHAPFSPAASQSPATPPAHPVAPPGMPLGLGLTTNIQVSRSLKIHMWNMWIEHELKFDMEYHQISVVLVPFLVHLVAICTICSHIILMTFVSEAVLGPNFLCSILVALA